jgi:hypothetical protein
MTTFINNYVAKPRLPYESARCCRKAAVEYRAIQSSLV